MPDTQQAPVGHATAPESESWPPAQIRSEAWGDRAQRLLFGASLGDASWRLGAWTLLISAVAATLTVLTGL